MKLSEIVEVLELKIELSQDIEIEKINTLKDAKDGEISFLQNSKYSSELKTTNASAVLLSPKDAKYIPEKTIPLLVDEPYIALAKLSKYFATPLEISEESRVKPEIGEESVIAKNVFLGSNVKIGKGSQILHNTYIGDNVVIGDYSIIYPNTTVYKETIIGNSVIIHSGTVVGSDGFGFATTKHGEHIKIYQNGNVVIEDGVEIGSNTSIDRAVFNSTFIRKGARIDNLVQIAHNCDIGVGVVLAAQSGVAGSSKLGRNVVMGGQSGITGHVRIAPFSTITARSGVTKSIKTSGRYWSGFPAVEHKNWLKLQAKISKFFNKG
jgi:UDP-3-O-[3-hydroxymyristoyl] glucosamine N-acyltransferase